MDLKLRFALAKAIKSNPAYSNVIQDLQIDPSGHGTITYNAESIFVDPLGACRT